ncbi:MAG TPA: carbohydrate-binding family V/XII [Blastocatellia bacterium]
MKKTALALISLIFLVIGYAVPFTSASAQTANTGAQPQADQDDMGWPRKITSGGTTLLFYQPQVEKWEGNQIQAYAAVAVQESGSQQQTFGVVYFTARTEVDKVNRLVTLDQFNFDKGNFPTQADKTASYLSILRQSGVEQVRMIALDRLLADLAVNKEEEANAGQDLKNDPPRIIFSTKPAVLVLVDGQPVLRPAGEDDIQRVINTRALLLLDSKKNTYYLTLMDGWVRAPSPEGPWTYAKDVPGDVNKVKDKLAKSDQVDLLTGDESNSSDPASANGNPPQEQNQKPESLKDREKDGTVPDIYVSTVPAELLIAQGAPQFAPITGTSLLYMSNTGDEIFLNTTSQSYYVLVSGRWFTARAMDGPWQYVDGKSLPPDFAKIPEGGPKASALASVPGTPAAEEARISNDIPQTATVTRNQAQLTVDYDGQPDFKPIQGTSLQYAINTATPVIEVAPSSFFAVRNGVWFDAGAPVGPWAVATSVPTPIYSIPASCPLHYVTYVRIYNSTPDVVYCGYTPGYYGTVVDPYGCVVYGTGWYYPPYIGGFWVGWPWTYGIGADFFWSPWGGWGLGFGFGFWYPFWRPWWGPLGFGWGWARWAPGWGWRGWGGVAALNVYGRWGRGAVVGTRAAWASPRVEGVHRDADGYMHNPRTGAIGGRAGSPQFGNRPATAGRPGTQPGGDHSVFAGKDGNVYRYDDRSNSWQQRSGNTWQQPKGNFDQRSLDQARQGRSVGQQRSSNFHFGGGGGFGGGGFGRGGGGFGGGFGGGRRR